MEVVHGLARVDVRGFVSDRLSAPLFPTSDSDAAKSPLVKGAIDPMLHPTIGNLKQLNANANGVPGTLPQTDWFNPPATSYRALTFWTCTAQCFLNYYVCCYPSSSLSWGKPFAL